ncbi:hypothetical protein HDF19_06040 [Mucilaginibacter sp. E4BP6]|uniref:hypothetical protein n=1 Tax=Mucilaginibacter sp. E4BP6 TaxID=2723089 RepID=UPI0017E87FFB|nr:hypothetical protein [Mucilaginibacter sp. E4BP6]NYE68651.1 hypothetical protein [Mucilaginibacter sp. E4BP6]
MESQNGQDQNGQPPNTQKKVLNTKPVTTTTTSETTENDPHPVSKFLNNFGVGYNTTTSETETTSTTTDKKVVDQKTGKASLVETTKSIATTVKLGGPKDIYAPVSITQTAMTVTTSTPIVSQNGNTVTLDVGARNLSGLSIQMGTPQALPLDTKLSPTLQSNVDDAVTGNKIDGLQRGYDFIKAISGSDD